MKRCIVSGGSGFIGSHLCEKLLDEGYEVISLDNFATGRRSNVRHLEKRTRFTTIKHDVSKQFETDMKIDYIFHLASPASPVDFHKMPIEIALTNFLGAYNLLLLAKRNKAKFLLASTSEVYGEPLSHPQKETDWGNVNPIGARSCYDESKRVAEALTMSFLRRYDVDVRIIRIFNTYGPRMRADDGRVVPNFVMQCLGNEPLTVYGDGKQTRSFCFVTDLVDGIYRAMFTQGTKGEVFNLGNPHEISILEIADAMKRATGSSSEILFRPLPKDDPTRRRPDISKAREMLGYEPKVPLGEGLRRTVEFFRKTAQ